MLLGILAAVAVVTLWERWRKAELTGSLLLAVTAAGLIAGQFAGDLAVASALRWTLAVAFVVCSLAVWQREHVLRICRLAHTRIDVGSLGPRIARAALVATAAAPVLAITVLAAMLQIGGTSPGGPAADSFFERLGPNVSYVVPLVLVLLGLVGHAVRERSAGYAFSAGLVAELIVTLGYALKIATDPKRSFEAAGTGHAHPVGHDHGGRLGRGVAGDPAAVEHLARRARRRLGPGADEPATRHGRRRQRAAR